MQKCQRCGDDDDKTTVVVRVGSNAGRGHGGNLWSDVAVLSGAGQRTVQQENWSRGVQRGVQR